MKHFLIFYITSILFFTSPNHAEAQSHCVQVIQAGLGHMEVSNHCSSKIEFYYCCAQDDSKMACGPEQTYKGFVRIGGFERQAVYGCESTFDLRYTSVWSE
ncbi:hypothetical protein ROA7450_03355 [Roseovarius albus]|uniref:Uncharacterized protein n=1 Tax=Roseovarius albus TaxID=1247867 RepID=A0A1X6ZWM7_9RHOB|nr:hypothetical protein [Roseovarius albus]SLN63840.1 hypothetical protein ROA7450_03355 [Roseovarius albus]